MYQDSTHHEYFTKYTQDSYYIPLHKYHPENAASRNTIFSISLLLPNLHPRKIVLNNFFIIPSLSRKVRRSNPRNPHSMPRACTTNTTWIIHRLQIRNIFTRCTTTSLTVLTRRECSTIRTRKIPRFYESTSISNHLATSRIHYFCYFWRAPLIAVANIFLKRIWIIRSIISMCIILTVLTLHVVQGIGSCCYCDRLDFFCKVTIRHFSESLQIPLQRQMIDHDERTSFIIHFDRISKESIIIPRLFIPIRDAGP